MAYAGHQFGHFVRQLGDGRAILLGEVLAPTGDRYDIQLKGAGQTPFSRRGDGRAALGPVLREYIVSEAMHALGVPTTRSLAVVTTGEPVYREGVLPGAILTRVAASHIRVGTFQFFAARSDIEAITKLADHVIERHYPETRHANHPTLALLEAVVERQAFLVARWLQIGFIHGVMNTDNTAISGETIDYGPCAFMDAYHPEMVFSSIDHDGRYAFANQPKIAQWNLSRLAETLLPLLAVDPQEAIDRATEVINTFGDRFQQHWLTGMRRKLGLSTIEEGDPALIQGLLDAMQSAEADYTLVFRGLCAAALGDEGHHVVKRQFPQPQAYEQWAEQWMARLSREPATPAERAEAMRQVNPAYIPRNHRIAQVIAAAVEQGDFTPFEKMIQALAKPYEDIPEFSRYAEPPKPDERVLETFCGT